MASEIVNLSGVEPLEGDTEDTAEACTPDQSFVGRSTELSAARRLLLRPALTYKGILIRGEPGSGKSRFLRELKRRLLPEDCTVIAISLQLGDSFAAFSLLRRLLDRRPLSTIVAAAPQEEQNVLDAALLGAEYSPTEEALLQVAEARQQKLIRILTGLLGRMGRPLVIMIDDVRFADHSSLAALHHLCKSAGGPPFRLICADRGGSEERSQGRSIRDSLLLEHTLDLGPLDSTQSRQLTIDVFDKKDYSKEGLDRIVDLAGGNPLFLIELARQYPGANILTTRVKAPETLEKLIGTTIERLSRTTRALLKVLSVQLGTVSLEALSAISEMRHSDLLASIDEARSAKIISCDDGGVRFRHGLMQEWLYSSLATVERKFLHSATASHLRSLPATHDAALAIHLHRAGEGKAAARASLNAAADALQRGACADAIAFLEIALDSPLGAGERFSLLSRLGLLHGMRGNIRDCLRTSNEALALNDGNMDQATVWRLKVRRALAAAELGTSPPTALHRELESVIDASGQDEAIWLAALDAAVTLAHSTLEPSRARVLLKRLQSRSFSDRRMECRACLIRTFHIAHGSESVASTASRDSLRIARSGGYRDLLMKSISRAVIVRSWQGQLEDRQIEDWRSEITELAEETGDIRTLWSFHVNVATWYLDILRLHAGHRYMMRAKRIAFGTFDPVMDIGLQNNLGEYYLLRSDFAAASQHFRQALASPLSMRKEIHLSACAGLGYCLISQGRLREGLELDTKLPSTERIAEIRSFDPSGLVMLRARTLLVAGRPRSAMRLVQAARHSLEQHHAPAWLKLGRLEVRLLRRTHASAREETVIREALARAEELKLTRVAAHFRNQRRLTR